MNSRSLQRVNIQAAERRGFKAQAAAAQVLMS